MDRFDSLQFNDQLTANEKIESRISHNLSFEFQHKWFLALVWNVAQVESNCQCLFIHRFQEPWSENAMDLNGSANYLTR